MDSKGSHVEVAIIDYQMSNLHSVQAACQKVGLLSIITSDPKVIMSAKSVILPGVGAFGQAMTSLKMLKLDDCIKEFIKTGKPFLGICLGMQLLFSESDELGAFKGLDIIEGQVRKFNFITKKSERYPVPQVGWNRIKKYKSEWKETLLRDNRNGDFMYFVHSYYVVPQDTDVSITRTLYGTTEYCSALSHNNIFATQFHPEKSGRSGLKIYQNLYNQITSSCEEK